jgi:hypothetical protein
LSVAIEAVYNGDIASSGDQPVGALVLRSPQGMLGTDGAGAVPPRAPAGMKDG